RIGGLADDADLAVGRPDETADDHRDIRVLDIFLQPLLDLPGKLGRGLAGRHDVFDQRGGDAPVRPHRDPAIAAAVTLAASMVVPPPEQATNGAAADNKATAATARQI